ncbi:RNA polymerase sigma factor [Oceanirhabdus sp. W0125-5]|uniref:RNA polymerase sigma factor n=1 Tax=Oceanirhabdus sp. W0125-5 TaxID=2999116 RepID=UPI0022F2F299|nr:sigma-70 family RNA polymerase sigma factor [Oceanirhabdus sp. W0125-5]WBW98112.1 sigma-70 family RNA polymerase sigma factor [Oceanirhabdus sp. W0125-5]
MDTVENIVKDIQNGHVEKYEILIEKYQQQLYKYIYYMVGDIYEAEDLLQDVFLKAYEKIDKYQTSNSFSAWLYKIAYNHSINFIRKRNIIKFVDKFDFNKVVEKDSSIELAANNEFDKDIEIVLSRLTPEEKNLLILRIFEEKNYDEIAMIFDKKPAAIRKKYERARKKFIKYYEGLEGSDNIEQYAN